MNRTCHSKIECPLEYVHTRLDNIRFLVDWPQLRSTYLPKNLNIDSSTQTLVIYGSFIPWQSLRCWIRIDKYGRIQRVISGLIYYREYWSLYLGLWEIRVDAFMLIKALTELVICYMHAFMCCIERDSIFIFIEPGTF